MEKKKISFVFLILLLVFSFFIGLSSSSNVIAGQVNKWNCSCWGNRRGATELYHWWGDEMQKRTDGRFKVIFQYGGVLAPAKENLDGVKAGLFEMGMMCSHYHPNKVPLHEVTNLPFFSPLDVSNAFRWEKAIFEHPALVKWLKEKWNAVIIIPQILPRYEIMSRKPVRKVEDFKGLRVHASKAHGRIIREYGAVITTITGAEIYNALDRGIVDAVVYPWTYAFGAYKLYEPAKYSIIDINFGIRNMPVFANADKWNSLPKDIKKIHNELLLEMTRVAKNLYAKADAKWIPIFEKNTEIIHFPPNERAKLLKVAGIAWKEWAEGLEAKGLPAREILGYAKAQYKEITGKALVLK